MVCMYTFNGFQLPHIATTLGFVVLGADSDQHWFPSLSRWGSYWGLRRRRLEGSGQEQQELMFRYLGHNGFLSACSIRSVWKSNLFPAFRLPGGVTTRVDSSRPCGKTWSVSRRPVSGVNKAWPRMSKNLQYFPRTNHRGELLPNHHLVET